LVRRIPFVLSINIHQEENAMSTFVEIKNAIDKQAEAFEEFKKTNDERLKAVGSGNEAKAKELGEKLAKIEVDVAKFGELKKSLEDEMQLNRERLEDLEARASSPGKSMQEKVADEYKAKFFEWIRHKGQSPMLETQLHDLMRKDVTIATPAGGGYAVPEEISRQIGLLQQKFSPVRRLVKVVTVGTSDYKELIDINGVTAGWVGETDTRTATATSSIREVAPTHGELYAYPQASEWSLDDVFFNVDTWISETVARAFARAESEAVIRGNGTNKPTGMLNTAPVTTADDAAVLRAAAAYQYVPSADNSPAAVDADSLIDLTYTLNSSYRANGVFVMNSTTTGAVRKLKDTYGQYLWQPSLAASQPDRLLGYPIETWEQVDDIGGGLRPVAFGDFGQGYLLTLRTGLRITRDNVTNVGYVRFYVRQRVGGIVLNNDAIKWLQCL
jgi:HK97 family phage major capsid protein